MHELEVKIQQKVVRLDLSKHLGTLSLGALLLITALLPTLTEFGISAKSLLGSVVGFGVSLFFSGASCFFAIGGIDSLATNGKPKYDGIMDFLTAFSAGVFAVALVTFMYAGIVRLALLL